MVIALSQTNRSHYRASVLRFAVSPRSSKYLLWLSIMIRGVLERVLYEMYVSNGHYMCSKLFIGQTGLERETLLNHSDIS
jgi:hypothetical protein